MAWFGQGRSTIEWQEYRDDILFYKWPETQIKDGAHLIVRPGQKAIFYANGVVGAVFEQQGNFDIFSEIVPFYSALKGWLELRGDSGMRAEVYFVNSKELLLPWGTRQRIMIPTPEVPTGIPVGCNGNLIVEFRDYQKFIEQVAGVKESYSLDDISERIMGELGPVVAEAILGGEKQVGMNVLTALQQNSRKLGQVIREELDKELADFGLGVADVNILGFHYPEDVQSMAGQVAAQSFVDNVSRYAAIKLADSFGTENAAGGLAGAGAGMAMGAQMAKELFSAPGASPGAPQRPAQEAPQSHCPGCGAPALDGAKFCHNCGAPLPAPAPPEGDRFCPKCRKMTQGKFCPDCGTETV